MSIETLIGRLVDAVEANTAAHEKFAAIARAAADTATTKASKPATANESASEDEVEDEEPKETAAQKKKRLAAEKAAAEKAAAEKAAAEKDEGEDDALTVVRSIGEDELKALAQSWVKSAADDDEKAVNKKRFAAALAHLGADNLSGVCADETDRAKLATYIENWKAGRDFKLRAADDLLSEDDEDMLG